MKSLLGKYGPRKVSFIQGDLEMPEDFVKASGQYAAAVYLLANRNNPVSLAATALNALVTTC